MRRTALLAFATSAALALAACTDSGGTEAEATAEAAGTDASATAAGGARTSADPDTPVSNVATPGASPAASTTRTVDSNPPGDECGASKIAPFASQVATPAVRARIVAEVGHNRIRWIGPDTAVTEDYSPQRLNVMLDRADVITSGRCG